MRAGGRAQSYSGHDALVESWLQTPRTLDAHQTFGPSRGTTHVFRSTGMVFEIAWHPGARAEEPWCARLVAERHLAVSMKYFGRWEMLTVWWTSANPLLSVRSGCWTNFAS